MARIRASVDGRVPAGDRPKARAVVVAVGVLSVSACDRADAELDPFRTVLDATQDLATLAPAEALVRVRAAREARDLPALASHEARLVLEAEGLPAALQVLDEAIQTFPRAPGLRWDRASLHARAGRLDAAARDLRGPVGRGELSPAELGRDADLAALGGDPRFSSLVRLPELRAVVSGRPDGVVGDRWELEMVVRGPAGVLSATNVGGRPAAQLGEVVEDVLEDDPLEHERRIQWRGRLTAPGPGRVGPWLVRSGTLSTNTTALGLDVTALGTAPAQPTAWPSELPIPSSLRGEEPLPLAGRRGAFFLLAAPAHLAVVSPPDCVRLERRSSGRRDWHGALCPLPGDGAWSILDGDRSLLAGTLGDVNPDGSAAD